MSSMGFLVQGAKVGSDRGDRYAQIRRHAPHQQLRHCVFGGLDVKELHQGAAGEKRQFLQRRFPQIRIRGSHQHRFRDLDINPVRITRHTAACETVSAAGAAHMAALFRQRNTTIPVR